MIILQGLRISVPYALAALGGSLSERSGVVNLGLEGMLLGGAFAATVGSHAFGVAGGAVFGMVGGLIVAAVYALSVLYARADQIVAGVAVNLLVAGATRFLLKVVFQSASSSPRVPGFGAVEDDLFVAFVAVLVVAVHFWIARTTWGLRMRAVGEHPEAADSLGVPVLNVRLGAVLSSGILAGLGGAWLALDNHGFVDRMTAGRGYIAIAAVIMGRWTPLGASAACLLFGFAKAVQEELQNAATSIPGELVQMLPYALTIVTLCGLIGRSRAPKALGVPWSPR